ncbi:MAG: CHAD domain-containing protein [Thermomicrobiales bacterium]
MTKSIESSFDPNQRFCSVMKELIAARFGALWEAIPVAIDGTDVEGVHDVRVATRRLRAAMDVAADCFPADWYRPLRAAAKEITVALGEVRDRDVMLEALRAERSASAPEEWPGIDRLIARIERERDVARTEMLAFLASIEDRQTAHEAEKRFGPAAAFAPALKAGRP